MFCHSFSQSVKRGRNEGTFNIPATNVMGNGNITFHSNINGFYGGDGFGSNQSGSVSVGIADILQFTGKLSFINFRTVGTSVAEAQITTPGNNRLRFLGLAIHTSLFLSTSIDTVSNTASEGKPEFHSYIQPSIIIDFDWLARPRKLPLKTYFWIGMYDNPDLLYRYSQLAFRSGLELKFSKNSFYIDGGLGFYKENKSNTFPGDKNFEQQTLWIEPGLRYRLFNRISIISTSRILLIHKVKKTSGLIPCFIRISTGIEIPLIYKETNTEAIRTMIFVEKEKIIGKDHITRSIEEGRKVKTDFDLNFDGLDQTLTTDENEQESVKKREDIKKKMNEIESMLEALDDK